MLVNLRLYLGVDRLDLDIKIGVDQDIGPWSNISINSHVASVPEPKYAIKMHR
jgi:hypothetical protein